MFVQKIIIRIKIIILKVGLNSKLKLGFLKIRRREMI
jgi:hypothetical protein